MSGQRHTSEATCPTCGNDEAIVRVRGNAFSSVCTVCRRADVSPLLDSIDLVLTEGETMEAQMFELAAARMGSATALVGIAPKSPPRPVVTGELFGELFHWRPDPDSLSVDLRLPVPPR